MCINATGKPQAPSSPPPAAATPPPAPRAALPLEVGRGGESTPLLAPPDNPAPTLPPPGSPLESAWSKLSYRLHPLSDTAWGDRDKIKALRPELQKWWGEIVTRYPGLPEVSENPATPSKERVQWLIDIAYARGVFLDTKTGTVAIDARPYSLEDVALKDHLKGNNVLLDRCTVETALARVEDIAEGGETPWSANEIARLKEKLGRERDEKSGQPACQIEPAAAPITDGEPPRESPHFYAGGNPIAGNQGVGGEAVAGFQFLSATENTPERRLPRWALATQVGARFSLARGNHGMLGLKTWGVGLRGQYTLKQQPSESMGVSATIAGGGYSIDASGGDQKGMRQSGGAYAELMAGVWERIDELTPHGVEILTEAGALLPFNLSSSCMNDKVGLLIRFGMLYRF